MNNVQINGWEKPWVAGEGESQLFCSQEMFHFHNRYHSFVFFEFLKQSVWKWDRLGSLWRHILQLKRIEVSV